MIVNVPATKVIAVNAKSGAVHQGQQNSSGPLFLIVGCVTSQQYARVSQLRYDWDPDT